MTYSKADMHRELKDKVRKKISHELKYIDEKLDNDIDAFMQIIIWQRMITEVIRARDIHLIKLADKESMTIVKYNRVAEMYENKMKKMCKKQNNS